MKKRCDWVPRDNDLYIRYHDTEWGVPVNNDRLLFQKIILDGVQAGLSWLTVLKKRKRYIEVYDNFDPEKVARYDQKKLDELLRDPGIIRNRLKVNASVTNARAFLKIQEEFGSFDAYLWRFVDGKPVVNRWKSIREIPASTELSDKLSADLKKRGFKFVGTTIIYAFMQAVGLVNDHTLDCFRYREINALI